MPHSWRPEPHIGGLVYKRVRTEPLIVVLPSGHRLATRKAIQLRDIKGEPFIKPFEDRSHPSQDNRRQS